MHRIMNCAINVSFILNYFFILKKEILGKEGRRSHDKRNDKGNKIEKR